MEQFTSRVGIASFGTHLPKFRITTSQIAEAHGLEASAMNELGVTEKCVAGIEDDTLTISVQASLIAINSISEESTLKATDLDAVFVGSETHVYAVKPTSSLLASFLGNNNIYHTADLQFACKAGTAAMQVVFNMIKANSIDAGLAVGADIAKGAPADALEYTAAAGAAAFILADAGKFPVIAEIKATISYTTDTADFWREEGSLYPVHAGRFSGTSYQRTVTGAIKLLLEKTQLRIEDFDHVVLHMPNGKLPKVVAAKLGVSEEQMRAGFIVPQVGNTYAACSMIGLAAVLEKAKPNQKILLCSYGSGSGSDAFYIETTSEIANYKSINKLSSQIENKKNISYTEYKLIEAKKYD